MKTAVIVFPGSNCDRDIAVALEAVTGVKPLMVWHGNADLPADVGLVAVPGGFSYGDYLRSGAIAARSPIMQAVVEQAGKGLPVLGICNGFQVLTEAGLLPGALMRNGGLNFVCRDVALTVETASSTFTSGYTAGERVSFPVAHHDGNYFADTETLDRLEGEGRRVPLCGERQRLGTQHRRVAERQGQRPRHDAPPGASYRSGTRRHRWPAFVRRFA